MNAFDGDAVRFELPLPIGEFRIGDREANVPRAMGTVRRNRAQRFAAFLRVEQQQHLIADAEEKMSVGLFRSDRESQHLGVKLPRDGEVVHAETGFENAGDVFHVRFHHRAT